MGMTADDYLAQLQALLPHGPVWPRQPEAVMTRLLHGMAEELARIDQRCDVLLNEADPNTTSELLAEWETAFGLPDPCTGTLETVADRRAALVAKVSALGGQSRAYFIDLALRLGFVITIDEQVDADPYKWRVNAPETSAKVFTVGSGTVGDPLRNWGNELLECAIKRLAPAHTQVVFGYA